ncbi:hypothetical protein [Nocardia sp. NBC_01388]|uniref:hypothetical protein n=1 Tax=Nocardia sp. NBC_01388 TaxID=2903596 RepID=UPI003253DA8D
MLTSLRDLAAKVTEAGSTGATLRDPMLRYRSMNTLDTPACLDWQAQLLMSAAEVDDIQVCVGVCEFLTVQVGEDSFSGAILDDYSTEAGVFSPIFDGAWTADHVQDQFDGVPFNNALLVLSAILIEPVQRGHNLGAWMVSRVTHRMLPGNDGLVLMYPSPLFKSAEPIQQLEAVESLTRHWKRTVAVVPIDQHPGILGQSTAHIHLDEARRALRVPAEITVLASALKCSPEIVLTD